MRRNSKSKFIIALTALLMMQAPITASAKIIEHTIVSGDSFWKIANQYDVSLDSIYELNGMNQNSLIQIGDVLKIEVDDDADVDAPEADDNEGGGEEDGGDDDSGEVGTEEPVNPEEPEGDTVTPTVPKPDISPIVGKMPLIQTVAYVPSGNRPIGSSDTQAVAYTSEATIKLMPETDELITIDYKNTDIREIIAKIGKLTDKQVLYFGAPIKLTVSIAVVSPMKALEHVLSVATGLTYIIDDDVIIVGAEDQISNTFIYTDVTTTKELNYLTVDSLKSLANALRLEYSLIEAVNEEFVRIKATPKNIAYILLAIEEIDHVENFDLVDGVYVPMLENYTLDYITGKEFVYLAERFGYTTGVIYDFRSPQEVYLSGGEETVKTLTELAEAFDKEENMDIQRQNQGTYAQPYKLSAKTPTTIEEELATTPFGIETIVASDGRTTIYTVGSQDETDFAIDVISELDQEGFGIAVLMSAADTDDLISHRDDIIQATKASKSIFFTTDNMGVDEEIYYLYVVADMGAIAEVVAFE